MIVQISLIRNELRLLKELLPIWKTYTDGFVFMLDKNTDDTINYLNSVKEEYNILEVLTSDENVQLSVETDIRQRLFDAARKYSNKIICLDADEYLDGTLDKNALNTLLEQNPDTVFYLKWVQYTSINTIRVDGPWRENYKDRIGMYVSDCEFAYAQTHSTHLPIPQKQMSISPEELFVAHLQWMNKTYVAVKQYYWKVQDYVNNKLHHISVAGNTAYDESVNNFDWEEEYTFQLLKVSPWLFDEIATHDNYRIPIIQDYTKQYNIPDLGSWGYDFASMDTTTLNTPNRFKISVITAIGNLSTYEQYIPRWFENAQDQHFYKQTEHIIVYKEWSPHFESFQTLPNFVLIKQEDVGMYNAWNIGIKAATTNYVTNWNIDDLRHPINTKIKFDLLEKNPSIDMVYNWYVATTDDKETFYNLDMSQKSVLKFPDNFHEVVFSNCYAGPDPMWKKSLHESVGYFDNENFATIGDWEMWARFAINGAKFKLLPEVLCIYLDHDSTVSKVQSEKVADERDRLFTRYIKKV